MISSLLSSPRSKRQTQLQRCNYFTWTRQLEGYRTSRPITPRPRISSLQRHPPSRRNKSQRWFSHSLTNLRSLSNRIRRWASEVPDNTLDTAAVCSSSNSLWRGEEIASIHRATSIAWTRETYQTRPWSEWVKVSHILLTGNNNKSKQMGIECQSFIIYFKNHVTIKI